MRASTTRTTHIRTGEPMVCVREKETTTKNRHRKDGKNMFAKPNEQIELHDYDIEPQPADQFVAQ